MTRTILSIALCSTALAGPVFTTPAQAETLRMSWWGGDSRHEATQAALIACGEAHGHTIQPEFTGWGGHFEKIATQLAGGTEADIMQINWPWLPIFSESGTGFADLNDFADTIDLSNWSESQLAAGMMNGALNGLAASTTGRLFVFNTTTYAAAGLEVPTTWDELLAAGPVFAEVLGEEYYPFEATGQDASMLMTAWGTQKFGVSLIDAETSEIMWSVEQMQEAVEFYQSLVDNHVVQPWPEADASGVAALHENPRWSAGEIAGTYQWDSTYFKVSDPLEEGQEIVYTGLLTQDGAESDGIYRKASMVFSISANTEHPQAAAEVLNCLLNEDIGIDAMAAARGVPASTAARERLVAAGAIEPEQISAQELVLAATGPAINAAMEHPDVRSALEDTLELFAYGEIDAATAAEEMIAGVQEALDDM